MPGINDVHVHPLLGGRTALYETTFLPTLSLEEVLEVVQAAARKAKPAAWIIGGSWGSNFTTALSSLETLRALDEASEGHPVLLRDDSVHNRWVNSRALELAGIDANQARSQQRCYRSRSGKRGSGRTFVRGSLTSRRARRL
jgi:hypothetical protein